MQDKPSHFEVKSALIEKVGSDDAFQVTLQFRNTVTRLRRITGYLSNVNNFNEAKKAEAKARQQHI